MPQASSPRIKWVHIRLSASEHTHIEARFQRSDCSSISDYMRKTALAEPIVQQVRNASLDDFINTMVPLQKQLRAIGNNFDQAVRRLHGLRDVPDIQQWILLNEGDKDRILRQIEAIFTTINNAYKLWSRE